MLRLKTIEKSYGAKAVVNGVSLNFQAAKTYALIGPSGCGKSTLLRIIMGLISPDQGTVLINEQPLSSLPINTARRDFGYVIQSGGLFPHLTCRENAALPAVYGKWSGDKTSKRLSELSDLTDLSADVLDRYPIQVSGGQRQRVSLIRALMLDPEFLLLDEPLAALDPMIRSQLQTELHRIFRSLGKTVIIVTHDLHEAAYFADEIILLRDGVVEQQGSIDQLQNQPASEFVSEFIAAQKSHLVSTPGSGS